MTDHAYNPQVQGDLGTPTKINEITNAEGRIDNDSLNPVKAPKYIVLPISGTYYVFDGGTGQKVSESAAAHTAINWAYSNLTAGRTYPESVLLRGVFTLTGSINPPSYSVSDLYQARLNATSGLDMALINIDGAGGDHRDHLSILGGILVGDTPTVNQHGLQMDYVYFSEFRDIYIADTRTGIYATGQLMDSVFDHVIVRDATNYGWYIWGVGGSGDINEVELVNECSAYSCTSWGVVLNNFSGCRLKGVFSASNTLGIRGSNGVGNKFINCDCDNNGAGPGYSFTNVNYSEMLNCWGSTQQSYVIWAGSTDIKIIGGQGGTYTDHGINLDAITRGLILGVTVDHPAATKDCIYINDSSAIIVDANHLQDTDGSPTMRYCINLAGTTTGVIVGRNYYLGYQTSIYNDGSSGTQKLPEFSVNSIFDDADGNVTLSNIADYVSLSLADNQSTNVRFNVAIPNDFNEIVDAYLRVVSPCAGGTVMRWNVATDFGDDGEAYNLHSNAIASTDTTLTANQLKDLDFTAAFTTAAVALAGDSVGVKFNREGNHANDTLGDVLHILLFKGRYV